MLPDHAKFYINGTKFPWMNQSAGSALWIMTLNLIAQTFINSP